MVTAMTLIASAPDLSRARLIDAAADLIAAGGVRAASVRATAQAAGVSASAVSYHFGGREGLHAAAFAQARASAFQRQARALEDLARFRPGPGHLGDWLAAWCASFASAPGLPGLVRSELLLQAERRADLAPEARAWLSADRRFASALLDAFGLTGRDAGVLAEMLRALDDIAPANADSPARTAWLISAARHAGARIAGVRPPETAWRPLIETVARQTPTPAAPQPGSTPEAILDGAIRLMARDGAGAITHRSLAAECGVSLALTTHHFTNRGAILQAAFDRLYTRLAEDARAASPRASAAPDSVDAFHDGLAGVGLELDGALRVELAAMDELVTAARRDPALEPLALHLLAERGQTLFAMLDGWEALPRPVTREDAFLLSSGARAGLADLRLDPPGARLARSRERAKARTAVILGAAD